VRPACPRPRAVTRPFSPESWRAVRSRSCGALGCGPSVCLQSESGAVVAGGRHQCQGRERRGPDPALIPPPATIHRKWRPQVYRPMGRPLTRRPQPAIPGTMSETDKAVWHGTTVLSVRRGPHVVIAGDGQVTFGQTVIKSNAKKVRRLGGGEVIAGFAGATADAFALFERLEAKLEQHPGQLPRACVELAKDWRTDRYLRRLEAMMAVADKSTSLV